MNGKHRQGFKRTGLSRWVDEDRKRRKEAEHMNKLEEFAKRVLASIKRHDDESAAGFITNEEQRFKTTRDAIQAAQELGLYPKYDQSGRECEPIKPMTPEADRTSFERESLERYDQDQINKQGGHW